LKFRGVKLTLYLEGAKEEGAMQDGAKSLRTKNAMRFSSPTNQKE